MRCDIFTACILNFMQDSYMEPTRIGSNIPFGIMHEGSIIPCQKYGITQKKMPLIQCILSWSANLHILSHQSHLHHYGPHHTRYSQHLHHLGPHQMLTTPPLSWSVCDDEAVPIITSPSSNHYPYHKPHIITPSPLQNFTTLKSSPPWSSNCSHVSKPSHPHPPATGTVSQGVPSVMKQEEEETFDGSIRCWCGQSKWHSALCVNEMLVPCPRNGGGVAIGGRTP